MAKIHPFKAVRPTRDKAQLVSTRPITAYREHVLRAKMDDNPYTFLHIIHPEGVFAQAIKSNPTKRFQTAKKLFEQFKEKGILIQEEKSEIYIYRQSSANSYYTGIIAGASLDEYDNQQIKKHEATLEVREELFKSYLSISGFNAEPVLLTYPNSDAIDAVLENEMCNRPEFEFCTTDEIKHELWILSPEKSAHLIHLFEAVSTVYIADGHHRTASCSHLRKEQRSTNEPYFTNQDYFLAYFISDQKLKVFEYNRVIKTLNNHTVDSFLMNLAECFTVTELPKLRKAARKGEIICFLEGRTFSLTLIAKNVDNKSFTATIDAQILTTEILQPILGISDIRTSKHVDFIAGKTTMAKVEKIAADESNKMIFLLYPLDVEAIKFVAENVEVMPPKSTWIEPKLRSGLTVYQINE
jgi:uncharacterized protein (DUF1015 family)